MLVGPFLPSSSSVRRGPWSRRWLITTITPERLMGATRAESIPVQKVALHCKESRELFVACRARAPFSTSCFHTGNEFEVASKAASPQWVTRSYQMRLHGPPLALPSDCRCFRATEVTARRLTVQSRRMRLRVHDIAVSITQSVCAALIIGIGSCPGPCANGFRASPNIIFNISASQGSMKRPWVLLLR